MDLSGGFYTLLIDNSAPMNMGAVQNHFNDNKYLLAENKCRNISSHYFVMER